MILKFRESKMADTAILKKEKLLYAENYLADFDKILHTDGYWHFQP